MFCWLRIAAIDKYQEKFSLDASQKKGLSALKRVFIALLVNTELVLYANAKYRGDTVCSKRPVLK